MYDTMANAREAATCELPLQPACKPFQRSAWIGHCLVVEILLEHDAAVAVTNHAPGIAAQSVELPSELVPQRIALE